MVDISPAEEAAAVVLFGARIGLAERYVEHLATSGIERGLLGPREVPRLWSRHVLNCAVVERLIAPHSQVADVGSGAGLPGLALAIARDDLQLTLIEPLERRVSWLHDVVKDLNLGNVEIVRARAETAVMTENVDVVTARAVTALAGLVELTIPLLRGRGELLAIKGRSAAEEVGKAAKTIRKVGGTGTTVLTIGTDILSEPTTVVRIKVGAA